MYENLFMKRIFLYYISIRYFIQVDHQLSLVNLDYLIKVLVSYGVPLQLIRFLMDINNNCFYDVYLQYLRGGLGDCVFGFVYLMELSTPFVSLRGILSKMGLKTSKLYVINGLIMLGSFFFCRVAMFPYVCYMYSQVVGLPYWQVYFKNCNAANKLIFL